MNLSTEKIIKQLTEFWKKQSNKRKRTIIISVCAFALISVAVALLLNQTNYVVLYRGLSSSESSEILSQLDSMGVSSDVQSDGTILVPKSQEAALKMQLSSLGYPKTALGYDIFTSNSDFMTTDYEKKKYLIFQLQDRLQSAIKTLQGVENAIVTISVADDNSFVLQSEKVPSTASVVLRLLGSTELTKKQITGIEQLVAKSVPGLEGENVAVIDSDGNILNEESSNSNTDGVSTRFDIVNTVNETVKNKVVSLLEPVFGKSGISVAVNATIDFQKKTSQSTSYTGDNGKGIISEQDQSAESVNGGKVVGGVPGTETNTGVDSYQQSNGTGNSSANQSSSTKYLVNQLIESVENDGGEITDMTVAVMINQKNMSADDIQKYKEIVAYGVGLNAEKVVVTNVEFTKANAIKDFASNAFPEYSNLYLAGGISISLLLVIVGLLLIRKKRKKNKAGEFDFAGTGSALQVSRVPEQIPGEIVLNETREQGLKRQIKDFAGSNPNIVAQLLRTWLKEDDD